MFGDGKDIPTDSIELARWGIGGRPAKPALPVVVAKGNFP
jgi:hypothetical protein